MQHMRQVPSFSYKSRPLSVLLVPIDVSHLREIGFKYFMPIITYTRNRGRTQLQNGARHPICVYACAIRMPPRQFQCWVNTPLQNQRLEAIRSNKSGGDVAQRYSESAYQVGKNATTYAEDAVSSLRSRRVPSAWTIRMQRRGSALVREATSAHSRLREPGMGTKGKRRVRNNTSTAAALISNRDHFQNLAIPPVVRIAAPMGN
jgi:hypothetical protein